MAEAVVEECTNLERFYCHKCASEIQPNLPDYTCPHCQSGFIEQLKDVSSRPQQPQLSVPPAPDPVSQFAELWGRSFLDEFRQHATNPPSSSESASTGEHSNDEEPPPSTTSGESPQAAPMPTLAGWPQHTRISIHSRVPGERQATSLQGLIEELLRGFGAGTVLYHGDTAGRPMAFPFGTLLTGNLHGNPADYAWGTGGLDNIITQLLNQLEGTGPPPAPKEQIDSLPTVNITQQDIDKNLQCSVCMEDFAIDESVKKLPCNHHYHESCIKPWLEMHGTCPVCRKTLDGKDTKTDETTVLSEMEQMATSAQARDSEESSQNNAPTFYDMEEYD